MVAKKMMGNYTSNYYITLESGIDSIKDDLFIAKLRGNHLDNIYNIFTKGVSPGKAVED